MGILWVVLAVILLLALLGPIRTRGYGGPWNLLWLVVIILVVLAVAQGV